MNEVTERVEERLSLTYEHIKQYISQEETPELYAVCKHCKNWSGKRHDYDVCRDNQCFKNWFAYETVEWEEAFR